MENNKCSNEYNDVKSVCSESVLSKEQFKELYTFLNIIKPHFNDLCIVNGQFRSRSNDLTCIVETEFSYFKGVDFYIADIKMLVKMLYTFNKKAAITIVIDDTNVSFTDGCQSVQVMNADPELIDNKFMTDEEMKEMLDNNVDVKNLFIKEKLPKLAVYNINKITKDFNTQAIRMQHTQDDLNKGYFYISNKTRYGHTSNDTREYTIKLKEAFVMPMKKNHFFNVTSLPFIFNKAEMTLCYYLNTDSSIVTTIHSTTVDGLLVRAIGRASFNKVTEESD